MERIVRDGFQLDFRTKLGGGNFGAVYRGEKISTKEPVAVKVIDRPKDDEEFYKYLHGEVDVLSTANHKNIVELYHSCWTDRALLLFMEYCSHGDLENFLRKNPKPKDTELLDYSLDCAEALNYLHHQSPPIVHRDLKPGNVLVTTCNGKVVLKLADFGFSRKIEQDVSSFCGTRDYNPPEKFKLIDGRLQYGLPSDVFSLGLLIEAIIAHTPPRSVQPMRSK